MKNKNIYFDALILPKRIGFTLAEVLITLGIIGVLAAMTIPALITAYEKHQVVTKLQKAISVMNQAYKQSFDDVGEPSDTESAGMGSSAYFETYWAPYVKTAVICNTYSDCGYSTNTPFYQPGGKNDTIAVTNANARTAFYTMDGILYIAYTTSGSSQSDYTKYIIVDINGGRNPNKFGRDVFVLVRLDDGEGVQPYGNNLDLTDSSIKSKCISSNGWTCAEHIRRKGWTIDKDYPW